MWSWRLGSTFGIDIKVHVTFPLVLLWAAYQWGMGPDGGIGAALYGVLVILLLFGCVLLHELGHALTAVRYGVSVQDIVLLPIGGVAQLRTMPDDPRQELVVALAGPAVNVAIAALLYPALAFLTQGLTDYGLWSLLGTTSLASLVFYLFAANVILVVFNLIPAFPMDGGRVFRAMLALVLEYGLATTVAVRLGQLMAVGFALFGLWQNPLLILVAVFVFFSAGAELHRVALRKLLERARVNEFLVASGRALSPAWPLPAAHLIARQTGQHVFPVVDQGRLVGLVAAAELKDGSYGQVGEVMHDDFPVIEPDATLYEAQTAMSARGQQAAAVVDSGMLLGLISADDLERALLWLQQQPRRLSYTS